jgi:peptidoglycan hydrolase-like protein with peptidoglycan-binding domain
MPVSARKWLIPTTIAGLVLGFSAQPAAAAHHHHHHTVHHHSSHHASGSVIVRIAQRHLTNLGYYNGAIDGKMGPQTRAAIKKFQREHSMPASGTLNAPTERALGKADKLSGGVMPGAQNVPVLGSGANPAPVSDDFSPPLNGGTRVIASRFARVDVSEASVDGGKRYNVNLNGQPILVADGQSSVIGISPTYDLGNEDAVVLTTFSPNGSGCTYRSHVLALTADGSKVFDLDSCTRAYDAVAKNGSLFITFTQRDSNSAVGSTWRLEGYNLQKL